MLSNYRVDLNEIDGDGDFPCPKCQVMISPDDETEEVYRVLDILENEDGLENIVIRCNNCHCTIRLEGFSVLYKETQSRIKISQPTPESKMGYRSHHTISLDEYKIGRVVVEYAQQADVKMFKKIRKIQVGESFKCMITIEQHTVRNEILLQVTRAIKKQFPGLRFQDIYVMEMQNGKRKIIGKASTLLERPLMIDP
jgi:hypothetical protein